MLSTLVRHLTADARLGQHPIDFATMIAAGTHLLWPWRCILCGKTEYMPGQAAICSECLHFLKAGIITTYCTGCGQELSDVPTRQERCGICQASPMAFEAVAIACRYGRTARQAIVQWKFSRRLGLEPLLVELLADTITRQSWHGEYDALVPIPQPRMRWLLRHFAWPVRDLAAGLAARDARKPLRPVWPVLRARPHRPQVGLTSAQRRENARHAFYVRPSIDLTGKRLCLVDDVMTTGSTLDSAAKALRDAGAERVWAIVVGKSPGTPSRLEYDKLVANRLWPPGSVRIDAPDNLR